MVTPSFGGTTWTTGLFQMLFCVGSVIMPTVTMLSADPSTRVSRADGRGSSGGGAWVGFVA